MEKRKIPFIKLTILAAVIAAPFLDYGPAPEAPKAPVAEVVSAPVASDTYGFGDKLPETVKELVSSEALMLGAGNNYVFPNQKDRVDSGVDETVGRETEAEVRAALIDFIKADKTYAPRTVGEALLAYARAVKDLKGLDKVKVADVVKELKAALK